MTKLTGSYEDGLLESLREQDEAAAYLNAALEEGSQDAFLMALRDVAKAHGLSQIARDSSLNRENIYRILSEKGNPRLSSLKSLLDTLGFKLAIKTKHTQSSAVAEE